MTEELTKRGGINPPSTAIKPVATPAPSRKPHVCGYCFIGAVPELPARCPHCNAKLTLTVQPKISPAEIVRRRKEAEDD